MQNRRSLKILTKPSLYPITLADLKAFLKIEGTDEDMLLTMIIEGCTDQAQIYCSRYFINHTLLLTLDAPPGASNNFDLILGEGVHTGYRGMYSGLTHIDLPCPPAVSITSVKTYSTGNVESVFSNSSYRLDAQSARMYLNQGETFPSNMRDFEAIKIEYIAGYGAAPQHMPAGLKMALLSFAAHAYECRGDCSMNDDIKSRFEQYKNIDMLGWVS